MEQKSKELMKRYVGNGLRSSFLSSALNKATKYEVSVYGMKGSLDMLNLAYQSPRSELLKHSSELRYLDEQLTKVKEFALESTTLYVAGKDWVALLSLTSKIEAEAALSVLECIIADTEVIQAIGLTEQLNLCQGLPPPIAVQRFIEGPCEHIRNNGYRYHKVLMRELARVERVMEIQTRIVGLVGTVTLAGLVGTFNVLGRLYYDLIKADVALARDIFLYALGAFVFCVAVAVYLRYRSTHSNRY